MVPVFPISLTLFVEYVAEARQSEIEAAGKTLHPLSTDSALRTDTDFDAFERQILDDDKN
ncbi:hypothetical protein CUU80_03065 [Bifidobacterium scaligerum]|uniref:Uncharacterized protein n=1 Tax=Bifidobacterium scaligerum TaxID=2052656 RepID=A0A2M9HTH7_9BIFI|nr:hypothetical protein CUU80_03065 [Bifidobacterium scaligerum]